MIILPNPLDKKRDFIVNALYYGLWGVFVFLFIYYGLNLISPFIFAFIFAFILHRLAVRTCRRVKLSVRLVSGIYVLIFYSTIGVVLAFSGIGIIARMAEFFGNIPDLYDSLFQPVLNNIFDNIQKGFLMMDPTLAESLTALYEQLLKTVGGMLGDFSGLMLGWVSSLVSSVPLFTIKLLLMIIATFFAAMDFDKFTAFASRQISEEKKEVLRSVRDYLSGTVLLVLRSYLIIMSITAIELSIGLTLIGIDNAVVVAICIAIFDILPVLGTGGIMIPWAVIELILGDVRMGISILAVYVFVTIVRNIIEPKIVGTNLGLHPLVTLMCIFVGAQLFGIVGLFGFPITVSLLLHLNKKGIIHIFK